MSSGGKRRRSGALPAILDLRTLQEIRKTQHQLYQAEKELKACGEQRQTEQYIAKLKQLVEKYEAREKLHQQVYDLKKKLSSFGASAGVLSRIKNRIGAYK